MSTRYDVSAEADLEPGLAAATTAVRSGDLIVLPTDTVYGIGADAFDPAAVARLLAAKGRGREMPPPVLVGSADTLDALGTRIPGWARLLVDQFWPGPLTLVVHHQPSLQWDLGDTRGTVAVRMPHDQVVLALLARTGPLAVSSANITGKPAATDADAAAEMLGAHVSVLLDGGPSNGDLPSTIVDCTGARARVLRVGVITIAELATALAGSEVELVDVTAPATATEDQGEEGSASGA